MAFSVAQRVALGAIAFIFAIGTSVLSWDNARMRDLAPRFHWPDETSNAYFAARVATGQSLAVPEPRNRNAGNLIHPRTVNVRVDGALVPGSYLGLPLWYGLIGRAVGVRGMLFVTPILAALGVLAFAEIMRRLWHPAAALWATVLLALHPSLWFFTATVFLPNVSFVALLLIGCAVAIGTRSWWRWCIAGFCVGLALTMRTHELLWVAVLAIAIVARRRPGWRATVAGVVGMGLPFLPILILQHQLYGSAFTTGYALLQDGGAAPTEFAVSIVPRWLTGLVAPFGWHPHPALVFAWRYLVVPYQWLWALAVVGMIAHRIRRWWIAGSLVVIAWLLLYYGSWVIADPFVRQMNVLTISYVRYWLPVTIIGAAWAGVGARAILGRVPVRWRNALAAIAVLTLALVSAQQIVRDPVEGLVRQRAALDEHRVRARAVIAATPPDAVIISDRMDKAFFPERAVVHAGVTDRADLTFRTHLAALVERAPVYWYDPGALNVPGFDLVPVTGAPYGEHLYTVRVRQL